MKISREAVEHVAHLGRLELAPEEVDQYTEQIDRILAYMDQLNSLDTSGIEPTTHAIPLVNVFREDRVDFNFAVEDAAGNAPERQGAFFKVPPVIEVE